LQAAQKNLEYNIDIITTSGSYLMSTAWSLKEQN